MKKQKFAALIASAAMLSALPLQAAAVGNYSSTLAADSVLTTSFDKYLVMDADAHTPNASFTYTIAPATADIPAAAGKLAVMKGVGTPVFTAIGEDPAGTVRFTAADTPTAEADKGTDTVKFATADTTDEQYVKKTVTVDFTGVPFTEPGVYRYYITEAGTNQGITNDAKPVRTLDVYVEDVTAESGEKTLKVVSYVMYEDEVTAAPSAATAEGKTETDVPNGAEAGTKSQSYTNSYQTYDLSFGKEVTGNQGSRDKYFDFTLTISGAVAGTVYTVDISEAEAKSGTNAATIEANQNKDNVQEITIGEDGSAETHFYLQDGQYITVRGLAADTAYALAENAEDYTATNGTDKEAIAAEGETPAKLYDDAVSGTMDSDKYTGFTNDRSGTVPTGILLSIAAPAIIGILTLGGIIFLLVHGKKRESEDA